MKKYKKIIYFTTFLFIIVISFTSCKQKDKSPQNSTPNYANLNQKLMSLESFETDATVTYISNKGESTYDTHQQAKSTGEYRIEVVGPQNVSGTITCFDGNTIYQYNKKIDGKVSIGSADSKERTEILLTSFLKNYSKSQEVSISVSNMDKGLATVLEAKVPGEHPYISSQKLWVDNETFDPIKLVVYDLDGTERIVVVYKNFEYNVDLDNSIFKAS